MYGSIPQNTKLSFSIDPNTLKANVSGTDDKLLLNLLKILNKVKTLELKKVVGLKKYIYILTRNHF